MPPSNKFVGVDFSEIPVEHLTPDVTISGQGFRCGRGEFVTYWRQGRIQREIDVPISQFWILRCEDSLVGYVTLLADKLNLFCFYKNRCNSCCKYFPHLVARGISVNGTCTAAASFNKNSRTIAFT